MDDYRYGGRFTPTADQLERWRDRLASGDNAIDWLWRLVASDMAKRRRARTCALLTLASPLDRNGFRGRSHLLLYDDETGGTGKSALGQWVKHTLPDAHGIGPDTSEAGLKFNANTGQPGKLAVSHEGILRIEEFEKFDKSDRQATYEAMSDGEFEVDKGPIAETFAAEVRVIALSNEPSKLADPLVTRFDYRVEMDEYGEQETITVAHKLQETFRERFVNREPEAEGANPLVTYLNWCSRQDPALPEDVDDRIRDGVQHLIETTEKTGEIRKKEGYLRTAYTIAMLNRRDIRFEDWLRAVDIIEPGLDVAAVFEHTDAVPDA